MTAFDHNFNSQRPASLHLTIISKAKDNCSITAQTNYSQNNTTVNFLNFGISSKFFVIILKFDHKVMPSKDADRTANSFNPDQAVSLRPAVSTEKLKGSSWLWEF